MKFLKELLNPLKIVNYFSTNIVYTCVQILALPYLCFKLIICVMSLLIKGAFQSACDKMIVINVVNK